MFISIFGHNNAWYNSNVKCNKAMSLNILGKKNYIKI